MVVAVALALIDELRCGPKAEKTMGCWGSTYLVCSLRKGDCFSVALLFPRHSSIAGMVLVTVQFNDINAFFVRTPADIGKITVGRIAGFQINHFWSPDCRCRQSLCLVIPAIGFVRLQCRYGWRYLLWIISYHAFVHAVESKADYLSDPESTFEIPNSDGVHFVRIRCLSGLVRR